MTRFYHLLSPVGIIKRSIYDIPIKKPSGFHLIPYNQQYETRDSDYLVSNVSDKTVLNRQIYVKEFNPYIKSHISDNLDQSLKDFYMKRYNKR